MGAILGSDFGFEEEGGFDGDGLGCLGGKGGRVVDVCLRRLA